MDIQNAILMFDALSQETRLEAFRLLVQAGPEGLPAGTISKSLNKAHNTMSFHLSHLSNAGLISARKDGRSMIYSANFEEMRELIRFMVKDCCDIGFAGLSAADISQPGCITLPNCYEAQHNIKEEVEA